MKPNQKCVTVNKATSKLVKVKKQSIAFLC